MSEKIQRALLSVSDKSGLVEFGKFLDHSGVKILSTGGSAKALRDAGITVTEVSDHTGFPEIMDGRVKTLQPKIHGGLLSVRDNVEHQKAMSDHGIVPIDLLVVNLYPFEEALAGGADFDTCVENIDIGGPAMIRAAAKNHAFVTVVVDPSDYDRVIEEMKSNAGATTGGFRRELAAIAYGRTGAYDGAISTWLNGEIGQTFPPDIVLGASLRQVTRYGENPHQEAAFYVNGEDRPGVATAVQLQGKELSYNNLNDTDAAFELVAEFSEIACAIIKHANPCGVAVSNNLTDAYKKALSCDTESAFGGIVAVNQMLDGNTAREIGDLFAEVIIAPEVSLEAREILTRKKNLRVLETRGLPNPKGNGMTVKTLAGGYLLQQRDRFLTSDDLNIVTDRQPTEQEMVDLLFAFSVAKHVKSNAIVYAKNRMTVGIGAGQMSRVNSSRIAAYKAEQAAQVAGDLESWAKGSVVASDAFFPFADGLLSAAKAGATAVIQPGGSVRDEEIITTANGAGLAMVFTGMRHFRH